MRYLLIISLLSLTFTQELKVEGNLNVTGAVINDSLVQVIDSLKAQLTLHQQDIASLTTVNTTLQSLINSLQNQITELQIQAGIADCNGVIGGDAVLDNCGVCNGDGLSCIVSDIDGNVYETVQIGDQLWFTENLKVTHYRNGDEIQYVQSESSEPDVWENLSTGAYGYYNDNLSYQESYGNIYNWYAVDDDRGICPEGFHVPSDTEFTLLTNHLGGESIAGGKMKETEFEHWYIPNTGATNESGFTALPSGNRDGYNGNSNHIGNMGFFWSSSTLNIDDGYFRTLYHNNSEVYRYYTNKRSGKSLRCLEN